jgi:hypothetical protein
MAREKSKKGAASFVALIAISFTCATVTSSSADQNPNPTPTYAMDSYKVAMEQFKRDRNLYEIAIRDRAFKIREINITFKIAIDKANSDSRNALATAINPLQKSTIASNRRNAINQAINIRDSSIAALGPMPTPPIEPVRQQMKMGPNKSKARDRR